MSKQNKTKKGKVNLLPVFVISSCSGALCGWLWGLVLHKGPTLLTKKKKMFTNKIKV